MLGKNIRNLRRLRGMTQSELARTMNVSPSLVGMWEQGRRHPASSQMRQISSCLGVSDAYLLGTGALQERQELEQLITQVRRDLLQPESRPNSSRME